MGREERRTKVAIYVRVSTVEQSREGYSLDAQLGRLRDYSRAREWEIAREYVEDGYTGRDVRRPAYQEMMTERNEWDMILVTKMDRVHRNLRNFMAMMDDLREWDKGFTSMQESLDTSTAMGRFVMDVIQRVAQLESEQIGERVYEGQRQKALSGEGIIGFRCPYGYYFRQGRLVLNARQAKVVKHIYKRYMQGKNTTAIAEELRRKKHPTKRGGRWAPRSISKILRNPIYCGFLRWDGIVYGNSHNAIVSVKDYNRAQQLLYDNTRNYRVRREPCIISG